LASSASAAVPGGRFDLASAGGLRGERVEHRSLEQPGVLMAADCLLGADRGAVVFSEQLARARDDP
jgi:hypothetical protein